MPANRNVTSIETYSGQYVDLLHPDPKTIRLADIAIHLANTVRFGGGVNRYYSVAEHAVRVSRLVTVSASDAWRDQGFLWSDLALHALHHDSHEFVLGDLPAPLKTVIRQSDPDLINGLELRLDQAIATALGLDPFKLRDPWIKAADDEAMYHEAAALKWSHGIGDHWNNDTAYEPWPDIGWSPARAVRTFLARHEELIR